MIMPPTVRKIVLVAHIVSSVGSLGAVASFLALALIALTGQNAQMMGSAYVAMEITARLVIVPLVLASLLTGIIQSLGTAWGLFRHYWVLAKLLLTLFTLVVLLLKLKGISYMALAETTSMSTDLLGLRRSVVLHATGGLIVLLLTTVLSVFKPRGMTPFGWRRQYRGDNGTAHK